ncbi:TPA: hypothetical protein DCW32_01090 [Candidatus Woesebacteria bacterium]|nr:hypothetical protein [Candidatus Woesebacteria bacterium]HCC08611.1 hypothetical protein [Candidatus Woesebacteria bacterium]
MGTFMPCFRKKNEKKIMMTKTGYTATYDVICLSQPPKPDLLVIVPNRICNGPSTIVIINIAKFLIITIIILIDHQRIASIESIAKITRRIPAHHCFPLLATERTALARKCHQYEYIMPNPLFLVRNCSNKSGGEYPLKPPVLIIVAISPITTYIRSITRPAMA